MFKTAFKNDYITDAAAAFEARWTMLALRRVDHELHEALREQQGLYHEATMHGSPSDIGAQGQALVRGYAAAVNAMEQSGHHNDAYLVGRHNGVVVVISDQKAVQSRLVDIASNGERAILMSPDEVALLLNSIEGLSAVTAIKQLFPGAEVIDRYPDQPAKGDRL
jgi:hypothetical protein